MKSIRIAHLLLSGLCLFGPTLVPAAPGPLGSPTGQGQAMAQDEISYQMPPGWVAQSIQGGPDLKAHYVLMSGGRPCGEMYLSQTAAVAGQALDQIFEQALNTLRPQLPYYQARGTQKTAVAGVPAILHEFSYMPAGAGVIFLARTYTFMSGASVFTFFFQSTENYFSMTRGSFTQVIAGVRLVPKPVPAPAPLNPVNQGGERLPAGQPAAVVPGGGIIADDMGLNFDLPAGWQQVDDPAGAKYRHFDQRGNLVASLFILKPQESDGMMALFGGSEEQTLRVALNERINQEYQSYQQYTAVETFNRRIGGYPGLVHDFTFVLNNRPALYRWAVFAVPRKDNNPAVRVAPQILSFGFLAVDAGPVAESRRQWNAIMDSMRPKGDVAPPAGPAPAVPGNAVAPAVRPKDQGGLPDLVPDEPAAGTYAEPFGRYTVVLPAGAVSTGTENNFAYYRLPSRKTSFILRSYQDERIGQGELERISRGKRLNGAPSTMTVSGRNVKVALYTGRDAGGDNMVWVAAHFENAGLLIEINLPADLYPEAKDWISTLIRGVRF